MNPNHRKLSAEAKLGNSEAENNRGKPCNQPSVPRVPIPPPRRSNTPPFPPPHPEQHHSHPLFSSIPFLLAMISLGFIIGILAVLLFCRRRSTNYRRRTNPDIIYATQEHLDDDLQPQLENPFWFINTTGLQQSVIDSIAVFSYKKEEGLIEGTECSVCLNEFQEDESLRLLPKCNHAFHVTCIDTWFGAHKNCPLCRAPIVISSNTEVVLQATESDHLSGSGNENRVENPGSHVNLGSSNDEETGADETSNGNESMQPMRRSVSLDSSSASVVHNAVAEAQMAELKNMKRKNRRNKLMKSSSSRRHSSIELMDMRRSSSFGGKLLNQDLNA